MRLISIVAAVVAMGCASGVLAQSGASACSLAATPGVSEQRLPSGGRERTYRLFVPAKYDGRTALPLVLDMHGSGGNAAGQAGNSRFEALAEREGVLVATLQAGAEGNRWNVPVTAERPDDVRYVSDVIDHVAARVCTDVARVYATGFSGGARMSSLLACKLNNRIAAIAPMSGLRWPGPCEGRAIPVLTLHGLADPQNTYDGHVEGRGGEWVERARGARRLGEAQRLRRRAEARGSARAAVDAALRRLRRRSQARAHRRARAPVGARRGRCDGRDGTFFRRYSAARGRKPAPLLG